ncbi:MAG: hypothetical protein FJX52_07960 [Alphaproteobacteria bacterium]|nr:hypothetical protein [Alphaproteobacteria bacterium]
MFSTTRVSLVLLLGASLLAGCATQPAPDSFDPPGFLLALAHGFVAPIALIGSLFLEVRVYAFPNSGWWYDLGFMLGVAIWGGGAAVRR